MLFVLVDNAFVQRQLAYGIQNILFGLQQSSWQYLRFTRPSIQDHCS